MEAMFKQGKLQQFLEQLIQVARTFKHVSDMRLNPLDVGVSKKNRSGSLINVGNCVTLGDEIMDFGFVWALMKCIGMMATAEDKAANKKLIEDACGILGTTCGYCAKYIYIFCGCLLA